MIIQIDITSQENIIAEDIKISNEEYLQWTKTIDIIDVPIEVLDVIDVVRGSIQEHNKQLQKNKENESTDSIYISDRRWRKIIRLLRTSAFLNGRSSADLMDCVLIAHCIWSEPAEIKLVHGILEDALRRHGYRIGLNLGVIEAEISEFQEEEINSHILEEEEPLSVVSRGKTYYVIEGNFSKQEGYNFVDISSYTALKTSLDEASEISFYNEEDDYATHESYRDSESKFIWIYYEHIWEKHVIKMHKKQTKKQPSPKTKQIWDKSIEDFLDKISNESQKVREYKDKQLAPLRKNLFVPSVFANIIESNLDQTLNELQDMKLRVEKIKHDYDELI